MFSNNSLIEHFDWSKFKKFKKNSQSFKTKCYQPEN